MGVRVSSPTLIGRGPELDRVAAALAEARDGHPAFFLVSGEAGVGKTRFLHEIAHSARAAGASVLEGGCIEVGTEGLPFGPLIEALRGLSSELSTSELDELLGFGRSELARLMPQLQPTADEAPGAAAPDGSAQGRLFEHVLLLFERLAARAPLIVVTEDVHWADRSTLDLLSFLGRNLRHGSIALFVSYRTDELHLRHPLVPFLAEQERNGRAERIELRRFDRTELTAQVTAILGAQPDPKLLERIAARSQGNAFYAEELLAADPSGRLPDTLREVLLARIATLSEPAKELVRLASAGGTRIAPAILAGVTGNAEASLDAALGEAVARHVLVAQDGTTGARFAFRHALVQEAAYGELLPGERTRLHAAFAQAIADEAPPDRDASRAAEIAYHWQAAHDELRAFDAWIGAGLAAETLGASAQAEEDFVHALELWDRIPDAAARAPLDQAELLTRAAFHAEPQAPSRSVAYVQEAIGLVDADADPTRRGLLYERLGRYASLAIDGATALVAYQEAVRLVPTEPPSAARSLVLSGLGRFYSDTNRPVEAVAMCEEALSVARASGARHVETRALVPLGTSQAALGDAERGLATVRQARDLAVDLGDVHEVARAWTSLAGALTTTFRWDEAAAAGRGAAAYASRHGLAARLAPIALMWTAQALYPLGRWDEAVEVLNRARRYELHGYYEVDLEAQLLAMEAERGQFEEANRRRPRVLQLMERFPSGWTAALADLALLQGDPRAARAAVVSSMSRPDIPVPYLGWGLRSGIQAEADLATLARSRHSEADLAQSRALGAALLERMRAVFHDVTIRVPASTPLVAAQLGACEAEFCRLEGTPDPDRWASTGAAWEQLHRPLLVGYARMREAEATLELRRDRPRAARALAEARDVARRLGALPLLRATEKLAARAGITFESADAGTVATQAGARSARKSASPKQPGGRAGPVPRGRYDLTPREREVLVLVADGRSDGEIGEALFISKKTASFHVAMIKGKLGARSRVEIATDAIGLGLIEAPSTGRVS